MFVGSRIRKIRAEKGIKQEDLATVLGISQGSLSKIENNAMLISVKALTVIANYTNTPLKYFLPESFSEESAVSLQENIGLMIKRMQDMEDWIKDLRTQNAELKEKIGRRDRKIDNLRQQIAVLRQDVQLKLT